MIKIIAVGKLKNKNYNLLIDNYLKQLSKISIIEVKDEPSISNIKKEEERILKLINKDDDVILLDVKGDKMDSIEFSKVIENAINKPKDTVFVIGGSYGVTDAVRMRANIKISFSDMTFPHNLMRLILVEQIYRGFKILENHPYHKWGIKMKYIFWDFNGTILNDVELCHNILNEMLEEHDYEKVDMEKYLNIFRFPIVEYYKEVFDLEKHSFSYLTEIFIKKYQPRSLQTKLNDGFLELYNYFKEKGYKQVVLSASEINNLKEQLKHFKIDHLFDDILGISDFYAKSKLDIAKEYVKNNNINPIKATMIGDTTHDYEIAKALGFNYYLYTKGHQSPRKLQNYKFINDFNELIV